MSMFALAVTLCFLSPDGIPQQCADVVLRKHATAEECRAHLAIDVHDWSAAAKSVGWWPFVLTPHDCVPFVARVDEE